MPILIPIAFNTLFFHFILEDTYNQIGDLPGGSDSKEFAYNARDPGSLPRLGRPPGEWNGTPL